MENNKVPGRTAAIWSFIFGLIAIVISLFGLLDPTTWTIFFPIVGLFFGILGLAVAAHARRVGYTSGLRILALIFSWIGVIVGIIFIIICAFFIGGILAFEA